MSSPSRTAIGVLSQACRNVLKALTASEGGFVFEQLEDRRLLSGTAPSLQASTTVLPFNATPASQNNKYSGPSRVESVTLTNNGSGYLLFDSNAFSIVANPTATTTTPSAFAIVTPAASLPTQLAPGQSAVIQLQYTATILGLESAILDISTNDPTTPTFAIDLNGIGTPGQFGTTEPSFAQVMRAYDIPTIVGFGPNDSLISQYPTVQKYPAMPDPSSQEVPMQRLVAADPTQAVTIKPLASFSAATPSVSRIGYYTPGFPATQKELFYIGQADAQKVQPTAIGATSFSPGSAPFGLFGNFPGTTTSDGTTDTHYSEDVLNTLDPTNRKIRFFPMKTKSGTVVPNTFVFAVEDYNNPAQYNSFINFVGLISNVKAAPTAAAGTTPSNAAGNNPAVMGVQLGQVLPGSNNLVFNTIKKPNTIVADVVHNQNTVTVFNTGDQPLTINSLTLSDSKNWQIVNPPAAGYQIKGESSLTLTIKFIATSVPPHTTNETNDTKSLSNVSVLSAGGVWSGTLTINSSDATNPTAVVNLKGYWQIESEHENEPSVQTLSNLMFGYSTSMPGASSAGGIQYPNSGNMIVDYPSEVDPSSSQGLLVAADPSQPVSLLAAASFHQQYVTVVATDVTQNTSFGVAEENETGTTVTVTTDGPTTFAIGDTVTIAGDISGYNGTFTITGTPATNMFQYTDTQTGLADTLTAATTPKTGWYNKGGSLHYLWQDQPNNGQSVFPLLQATKSAPLQTRFTPSGPFGLYLDGQKSQDSGNAANLAYNTSERGVRFWPAIDANGNYVPNTYIVGLDYRAYATPNGDYQDLYEIISNVTFAALPATPIDVQAAEAPSGVDVQWVPVAGVTGYNVYQVINGTKVKLTSSPITANSYIDTTALTGMTVQYLVTGVNASSAESPANQTSITVAASIPPAPTIQSADGSSAASVALSWSGVSGATSYIVSREGPNETSFTPIASNVTGTTYTDMNVAAGATYSYIVQAQNSAGPSPDSSPSTVTVAGGVQALSAPSITLADGSSGTQVSLTWSAVTGAATYTVEREGPGQTAFAVLASGVSTDSFVDTNVTAGATYAYAVSAQNGSNSSLLSSPASAMVASKAATLTAPTNLAADTSSGNSVVLTWDQSSGAATYTLERQSPGSSTFQQIATGLNALTYTDTNVVPGLTYEYAVQAVNGSNFSPFSTPPVAAFVPPGNMGTTASVNVGKGTNKYIQFTDANGTLTVIRMTGPGVATVNFTGNSLMPNTFKSGIAILSGSNISVSGISITGTSHASSLMITTKGGNGTVSIGGISADASLNNINARTATLVGSVSVAGSIGKVTFGAANSASINVGGSLQTLAITSVSGSSVTAVGGIRAITATTWTSAGTVIAPAIGSITLNGNATFNATTAALHSLHVRGILSNSTLTLTAGGTIDLATLSAGAISNSTINATGDLGSITAGSLTGSLIYAGIASTATLPSANGDFSSASFINNVTLRKLAGAISDTNSSVAASLVKHASLGYVQLANSGTPFGIAANAINNVSFGDLTAARSYNFSHLTSQAVVTADFSAKQVVPQDFVLRIV